MRVGDEHPLTLLVYKNRLLRYLQCLNLVNNYLHVYSIHTAPGFRW